MNRIFRMIPSLSHAIHYSGSARGQTVFLFLIVLGTQCFISVYILATYYQGIFKNNVTRGDISLKEPSRGVTKGTLGVQTPPPRPSIFNMCNMYVYTGEHEGRNTGIIIYQRAGWASRRARGVITPALCMIKMPCL